MAYKYGANEYIIRYKAKFNPYPSTDLHKKHTAEFRKATENVA